MPRWSTEPVDGEKASVHELISWRWRKRDSC